MLDEVEGAAAPPLDVSALSDDEIVRRLSAVDAERVLDYVEHQLRLRPLPSALTPFAHLSDDEVLGRLSALRKQLGPDAVLPRGRRFANVHPAGRQTPEAAR
jgi:hypothetical protein